MQWFKKKYCDKKFRTEVRNYFQDFIKTKDIETGDAAGTSATDSS